MGGFWAVVISLAYGSLANVGHLARFGTVTPFRYVWSQWSAHNGSIVWSLLTQALVTFRHITAACYGHWQVNPIVTFRNIPPGSTLVPSYVCTIGSAYVTDKLSLWYVCTLVRLFCGTSVPLTQLMGGISQAYGTPVLEYVCTRASLLRMTLSSNKNGSHYRSY
jgi:hypothetical protein